MQAVLVFLLSRLPREWTAGSLLPLADKPTVRAGVYRRIFPFAGLTFLSPQEPVGGHQAVSSSVTPNICKRMIRAEYRSVCE